MRLPSFCVLAMLSASSPAVHAEAALETIAPDGALANVQARNGVVFVDLFADWCMKCVRQMPVVEKLAREFEGRVSFVKVTTREDGPTLEEFDVDSYPAYLVFRDGEEIDRLTLNFAPWYLEDRLRAMIEGAFQPRAP